MIDLIGNYEDAVNAIVAEFKKKQNIVSSEGYWIGKETGGVYDFGDTMTFDFRDILTDIKTNAEKDEILKWQEYNLRIWSINNMVGGMFLQEVNYSNWLKGCPRLSSDELDKVEAKYKKLVDEVAALGKTTMENNANNGMK